MHIRCNMYVVKGEGERDARYSNAGPAVDKT
jgi:hypothetical protein